jgi:outer membrane protein assembly factor BamB
MAYIESADGKLNAFKTDCASGGQVCKPEWTATVSTDGQAGSTPAVANGMVYVTSAESLYAFPVLCGTGGAICRPRWTASPKDGPGSAPAVADGVVYVASGGSVLAYPADCGVPARACPPSWKGVAADDQAEVSISVANGVVYVGAGDAAVPSGALSAFAVGCGKGGATCKPLWRYDPGGPASGLASGPPTVSNGVVYVAASYVGLKAGRIYAFDTNAPSPAPVPPVKFSGSRADWPQVGGGATQQRVNSQEATLDSSNVGRLSEAWIASTGGRSFGAPPVVADGLVLAAAAQPDGIGGDVIFAFPVDCPEATGLCRPVWQAEVDGMVMNAPAVADGVMYVSSHVESVGEDRLTAFTLDCASSGRTCSPLWDAAFTTSTGVGGPAVANGTVFVGSDDGGVYAFASRCATGGRRCSPVWTSSVTGSVSEAPAVADGVVYFASNSEDFNTSGDLIHSGELTAFSANCAVHGKTCRPLWVADIPEGVSGSPEVAGGDVYVTTAKHRMVVYKVGCATAGRKCKPLWTAEIDSAAFADGALYAASGNTVSAFATECGTGETLCPPLWTATTGGSAEVVAVANGVVYVESRVDDGSGTPSRDTLYAFAVGCASQGRACSPLLKYAFDREVTGIVVADGMVFAVSDRWGSTSGFGEVLALALAAPITMPSPQPTIGPGPSAAITAPVAATGGTGPARSGWPLPGAILVALGILVLASCGLAIGVVTVRRKRLATTTAPTSPDPSGEVPPQA